MQIQNSRSRFRDFKCFNTRNSLHSIENFVLYTVQIIIFKKRFVSL